MPAMRKGHVKLGAPGALRDYLLTDPRQFAATPASPMAAKIATGGGKFDDFTDWSYWLMEDWSAGAGRKADDVGNGYLFGDAATFMRDRITLPLEMSAVLRTSDKYLPAVPTIAGEWTIGTTQTYKKAAGWIGSASMETGGWFLIYNDGQCTSVTIDFCSSADGVYTPGAVYSTKTFNLSTLGPGAQWLYYEFGAIINNPAGGSGTNYYLVAYPTTAGQVLRVPYYATDVYWESLHNGTAWTRVTGYQPVAASDQRNRGLLYDNNVDVSAELIDLVYFSAGVTNRKTWAATDRLFYYEQDTGSTYYQKWQEDAGTNSLIDKTILDLHVWGDDLYVACGTQLWRVYASSGSMTCAQVGSNLASKVLTAWNGYLYRAADNQVWYTGDGSTWDGPFDVGPVGTVVTGMAGAGEYVYIATQDGLYYLAPGDFVVGVSQWPSPYYANGARMVEFAGSLYIPLANRVWLFTPSGTLTDVWLDQNVDMPSGYIGEIYSLASTPMGVMASVQPSDDAAPPSVWLLTSEGWHCIALLANGVGAGRVVFDPENKILWVANWKGFLYRVGLEPLSTIPVRNPNQRWASYGMLETDWYTGNLVDVDKDWESVSIFGRNISAGQKVRVYYKASESGAWTLLGECTSDKTELRWLQSGSRPSGNKIKLALVLSTTDATETPEVLALRVKHHPMVMDRWRWQLPLSVHDSQQMLDGTLNSYTAAQQLAHLDGLVTRIPPLVFEDIGGTQYEVKVAGASKQVTEFEALPDGTSVLKWTYVLSLEQVTAGTYS